MWPSEATSSDTPECDQPNISKSAKSPAAWASEAFPDTEALASYRDRNALPELPASAADFLEFLQQRRELLRHRMLITLGTSNVPATEEPADSEALPPIEEAVESESLDE